MQLETRLYVEWDWRARVRVDVVDLVLLELLQNILVVEFLELGTLFSLLGKPPTSTTSEFA